MKNIIKKALISVVCIAGAMVSVHAAWDTETVETVGNVGIFCSLELDNKKNPHIAYYDDGPARLKYARWNGSAWDITTFQDIAAFDIDLVIDNEGYAHLSFMQWHGAPESALYYIREDASGWGTPIELDRGTYMGRYSSIALDPNGYPHIAYHDGLNRNLRYVFKNQAGWQTPVNLDKDPLWIHGDIDTDIEIDSKGAVHVSYFSYYGNESKVHYLTNNGNPGGPWAKTVISNMSIYASSFNDLAVDHHDNVHIVFFDPQHQGLFYRKKDSQTLKWEEQDLVDFSDDNCVYMSLTVDYNDMPHVAYSIQQMTQKLCYAYYDGVRFVVDRNVDSGMFAFSSMALDVNENPHIAYYDERAKDLKYAFNPIHETPSLTIESPEGGEHWSGEHDIQWSSDGHWGINRVTISYIVDNEPHAFGIGVEQEGDPPYTYPWETSNYPLFEECYIKIEKIDDPDVFVVSNAFVVDNTPPQAEIMESTPVSASLITWTGDSDEENSLPVEYWFESRKVGDPTWSNTRQWDEQAGYNRDNCDPNTEYEVRVKARDAAIDPNEGGWSTIKSEYTQANKPGSGNLSEITHQSIKAEWGANNNPSYTEYQVECHEGKTPENLFTTSPWTDQLSWTPTVVLKPATPYFFRVKARNKSTNPVETGWTDLGWEQTLDGPVIYLDSPEGGEYWSGEHTIRWRREGTWDVDTVNIKYFDGSEYQEIESNYQHTGVENTLPWDTDGLNIDECTILIEKSNEQGVKAESQEFVVDNIAPQSTITGVSANSSTEISWECEDVSASEKSPPVLYWFTSWDMNNQNEHNRPWDEGRLYTRSNLTPNTEYKAAVKAQDSADEPNVGAYSSSLVAAYTLAEKPVVKTYGDITNTSIQARWDPHGNPSNTQYYVECHLGDEFNNLVGTASGWITGNQWPKEDLEPATQYRFRVKARNHADPPVETGWTDLTTIDTLGNPSITLTKPGPDGYAGGVVEIEWTIEGYWDSDRLAIYYS
ncbi:MAG: hypothetical protein GF384_02845, partial [Elusimicrobia bacterium]|nr:hypothetical protein [Elusimicrobiota bacterium]